MFLTPRGLSGVLDSAEWSSFQEKVKNFTIWTWDANRACGIEKCDMKKII